MGSSSLFPVQRMLIFLDNSPLAGGINAAIPAEDLDDRLGTGAISMYWMPGVFDIKAGASQLILRNNHADDKLKTANNIVDITGGLTTANTAKTTKVWPIIRAWRTTRQGYRRRYSVHRR